MVQLIETGKWLQAGKQGPAPHIVKQANLRHLALMFGARVFVETGTFRGDMLWALKDEFDSLFSIELSEELCRYSRHRCAPFPRIKIHQGDSSKGLLEICANLSGRVVFWLDGHYSGGDTALGGEISPILGELATIQSRPEIIPIIVIDDARLFNRETGYPELGTVLAFFDQWSVAMNVSVHDDAIVAVPRDLMVKRG